MKSFSILSVFAVTFSILGYAQNPSQIPTALPKKTLAETLGLPNTPPSPTTGAIVIEEKAIELKAPSVEQKISSYGQKSRIFSIGANYVHSKWSEFTSQIDDGSLGIEFSSSRTLFEGFEAGLGLGWFSGVPNTSAAQNQFYTFYITGKTQWELMNSNITPTAGLDIQWGSYRIWSVDAESDTNITFSKLGAGTLLGFVPHAGVRFHFSQLTFMDINLGYHGYVDAPQSKLGGWSLGFNLGLKR